MPNYLPLPNIAARAARVEDRIYELERRYRGDPPRMLVPCRYTSDEFDHPGIPWRVGDTDPALFALTDSTPDNAFGGNQENTWDGSSSPIVSPPTHIIDGGQMVPHLWIPHPGIGPIGFPLDPPHELNDPRGYASSVFYLFDPPGPNVRFEFQIADFPDTWDLQVRLAPFRWPNNVEGEPFHNSIAPSDIIRPNEFAARWSVFPSPEPWDEWPGDPIPPNPDTHRPDGSVMDLFSEGNIYSGTGWTEGVNGVSLFEHPIPEPFATPVRFAVFLVDGTHARIEINGDTVLALPEIPENAYNWKEWVDTTIGSGRPAMLAATIRTSRVRPTPDGERSGSQAINWDPSEMPFRIDWVKFSICP